MEAAVANVHEQPRTVTNGLEVQIPQNLSADKLVQLIVTLRDKIADLEAQLKEKKAPLEKLKDRLSGQLDALLEKTGATSVATKFGTAYRTVKYSASLADPEAFMKFVIDNQRFDLIDRKANVTAVRAYVDELTNTTHQLPPGVNLNSKRDVNVRRK